MMLYYNEGDKVPVFGYRAGRKVLLRKALTGKSKQILWQEGLTECFSLRDGVWLLTSYEETEE